MKVSPPNRPGPPAKLRVDTSVLAGRVVLMGVVASEAPDARAIREGILVRQRGLEPPRDCSRQPLKLVRLPIPPLPLIQAGSNDNA